MPFDDIYVNLNNLTSREVILMNQAGDQVFDIKSADSYVSISAKLIKSINYIKLSHILSHMKPKIYTFIEDLGYKLIKTSKLSDRKAHNRVAVFESTNKSCDYQKKILYYFNENRPDLFFKDNRLSCEKDDIIQIYYPAKQEIASFSNIISHITSSLCKNCPISQMELTFDFYTNNKELLKTFLEQNIIPKYNQSTPNIYEGTIYDKNTRKAKRSKSIKIYIKTEYPDSPVRLEITLGDRGISNLGLNLENLDSVLNNLDFRKFISFKSFDAVKYKNLLVERIRRKNNKKVLITASPHRNKLRQDLQSTLVDSYIDYVLSGRKQTEELNKTRVAGFDFAQYEEDVPESAMGILHKLKKGEKKPHDFFTENMEASDSFFTAINQGEFLL